jgi:hypothetical protein
MPNRIHFWADITGHWFSRSSKATAENHAEEGHEATFQLTSLVQMHSIFRAVLKNHDTFDEVCFHTHGSPGAIYIGSDVFDFGKALDPFENQGFEKIFKPNATITFNGCNVGATGAGEFYLTEIGRVFLKSGGGKVMGNTTLGLNVGSSPPHLGGTWVTATVSPGGAVSLSNHTNLILSVLKERLVTVVARIEDLEAKSQWDVGPAKDDVMKAYPYITPPAGSSWNDLYNASCWLDRATEELNKIQQSMLYRPSPTGRVYPAG